MPHKTAFVVLNMEHKKPCYTLLVDQGYEINRSQSTSYAQY